MRLDGDIREVAEDAQRRRREAAERVKRGEIKHLNFMSFGDCLERGRDNFDQLKTKQDLAALNALADAVNYGLAVIAKGAAPEPDQEDES